MAILEEMHEPERSFLTKLPCPQYKTRPWASGPPLSERRVALISTAGLHTREDRPFAGISGEYRVIPGSAAAGDLVMSHVSVNFDRTGFIQDHNLVFPIDRLLELVEAGVIGSLADYHYSFMGAADPSQLEGPARELAGHLKGDKVDAVLLAPV